MMTLAKYIGIALVAVALSACGTGRDKEYGGTLLGAAAGGAIGSQIGSGSGNAIAIGTGVLLGGLLGNQIGKHLDEQDRQLATQNTQHSLNYNRSGTSSTWRNPDTGHHGAFTPQPAYQNGQGQWCREGTQTVWIDGQQQTVTNTYCRADDGSWRMAS